MNEGWHKTAASLPDARLLMQAAFLALDPSVERSTHLSRVEMIATGGSPISNKVNQTLHIYIRYLLWSNGLTIVPMH